MRSRCRRSQMSGVTLSSWMIWALVLSPGLPCVEGMRGSRISELRKETGQMFYHGFENYMKHAFPEDELRPISCRPLTRDRENAAHVELNDVLGNYSLTLVDSLSTLAILSSLNSSDRDDRKAWNYFQDGVKDLVELYGDGSDGPAGRGLRGKGFEVDSKVQVFETVIRGLGGLLSAHLFAVGDLPIRGYNPPEQEAAFAKAWDKGAHNNDVSGIRWQNGFVYDGQLLRLAMDLGSRLLPAFYTPTGLPYPRVNLRDGVPFYANSPLNADPATAMCQNGREHVVPEITETCSAGAGSLVLEFTVLSRLTGDGRFEELAKRAFWAVWMRRSEIGLIGAGIDAESGKWVNSYTGIGAGIDSFFEYALKSYILLSEGERPSFSLSSPFKDLDGYFLPLTEEEHSADAFLKAWQEARASIKHHLYRGSSYQHPHYIQGDLLTGATRAFWIDSLSAYFPGLLTLAGDVDGAIEAHLLNTAVWTRFSALPERWNVATGDIDSGLGWWGGRPEFIESTYYLYRATQDPWYLYVGEMVLRDIKRRCWTRCGWAGLQDVRNGELNDRMESFFLGETAKYMFLLFDSSHPLNHLDAPFVFTTEGHPLLIPKASKGPMHSHTRSRTDEIHTANVESCPLPGPALPLGVSPTAARPDIFHAASLARLHLMPSRGDVESAVVEYAIDHPSVTLPDLFSPSNYTFFPWTLPPELIPHNATSAPMAVRPTLDLSFPHLPNMVLSAGSLERVRDGVLVKSIGGLRLGMIQDIPLYVDKVSAITEGFRIQVVNNVALGKDERVYISRETTSILNPTDPNFTRMQDPTMLDIVIDINASKLYGDDPSASAASSKDAESKDAELSGRKHSSSDDRDMPSKQASNMKMAFALFMNHVTSILRDESLSPSQKPPISRRSVARISIPAVSSTGRGAAPLPDIEDAVFSSLASSSAPKQPPPRLSWSSIYLADEICNHRLATSVPATHQIIVVKRGGCSFSQKLRNIPSFYPSRSSLQLVIVVSYERAGDHDPSSSNTHPNRRSKSAMSASAATPTPIIESEDPLFIRPLLDEMQVVVGGIPRPHPISMVMVEGGNETYDYFTHALGVGIRRRYEMRSQGVPISNLFIL